MSTPGIHAAVGRVVSLEYLKAEVIQKRASLEGNPVDFPALIDLLIADLTAMRAGKDAAGVYHCMTEEIAKGHNLDQCAQVLLNFYENASPAMDHMIVEDKICQYIKLKAIDMINRYIGVIGGIARGRPLSTLEGEDLRLVLEYENRIVKTTYPNMSQDEREYILRYVQEVLRRNAVSEIPASGELQELSRVVESYQFSEAAKSLDDILRETKALVCTVEEGANFDDISRYLATIQFLMTILSTHSIMIKKEQEESVARLQSVKEAICRMYQQHGRGCTLEIAQRIQAMVFSKETEILKSGRLLSVDPQSRVLTKSDSDVKVEDFDDYLASYECHMEEIKRNVDALKSVLDDPLKATEIYPVVTEGLSEYFLEEVYFDDPLGDNIREAIRRLQSASLESVDPEFVKGVITLLVIQGELIQKDHLRAVTEESIAPTPQGTASAEPEEGDEVNAKMRALLQQLSLI